MFYIFFVPPPFSRRALFFWCVLEKMRARSYSCAQSVDTDLLLRRTESNRLRQRYRRCVPVVFMHAESCTEDWPGRVKFVVPDTLTMSQLSFALRKHINVKPETALFVFAGPILPVGSEILASVDEKHKNTDGFLYLNYSGENAFGSA